MGMMNYTEIESPIGPMLLAGEEGRLRRIVFQKGKKRCAPEPEWIESARPLKEAIRQLRAYFDGKLRDFDLPLAPLGTSFQMVVWKELQAIPYGETISYGELARRIGHPAASRAVGAANGQNPIPIIIPCHRVIGASGNLTGYGGGLPIKEALLQLEKENVPEAVVQSALF